MLSGRPERSFAARRKIRLQWVLQESPESGGVSATLRIDWRVPASFWNLGDGFWIVRLGHGWREKELAEGGFLDRKMG